MRGESKPGEHSHNRIASLKFSRKLFRDTRSSELYTPNCNHSAIQSRNPTIPQTSPTPIAPFTTHCCSSYVPSPTLVSCTHQRCTGGTTPCKNRTEKQGRMTARAAPIRQFWEGRTIECYACIFQELLRIRNRCITVWSSLPTFAV